MTDIFTPLTPEEENFLAQLWETMLHNRRLWIARKQNHGTTLQSISSRWNIDPDYALNLLYKLKRKKVARFNKHFIGMWPGPPNPNHDTICLDDRGLDLVKSDKFPAPRKIVRKAAPPQMARPTRSRRLDKARIAHPSVEPSCSPHQALG